MLSGLSPANGGNRYRVVMMGLIADGVTVAEVDVVEDGRGLRGSAVG